MSIADASAATGACARPNVAPTSAPFGDVMRRLMDVERRLKLFDDRIARAPYWEFCRLRVHYELTKRLGLLQIETDRRPLRAGEALRLGVSALRNAAWEQTSPVGERSIVLLGYPRRFLQPDGRWWDVHLDPLLVDLPWSHVYLRRRDHRRHFDPIPTEHAVDHDAIDFYVAAYRKLRPIRLQSGDERRLTHVSDELYHEFGTRLELSELVADTLTRRRALRKCYRRLFERVRPKLLVVLAPNEQEKAAVELARQFGIRTAEIQHGMFATLDPSYAFPADAGAPRCFADDLLMFGDYWKDLLDQPPPGAKLRTIGFQYFESRRAVATSPARKNQILVVSQGPVGRALSQFAMELARHPRFTGRVVFRTHPDETDWRSRYPWLIDAPLEVDDGRSRTLYEALSESRAQLGVYSFALFEGAALGVQTFVVDLPGCEGLRPLIDRGWATLVRTPEDVLAHGPAVPDASSLFRPEARRNFHAYLAESVGSPQA